MGPVSEPGGVDTCVDVDRTRWDPRSDPRARRWRRRLPDEAVPYRRTVCAAARADPPRTDRTPHDPHRRRFAGRSRQPAVLARRYRNIAHHKGIRPAGGINPPPGGGADPRNPARPLLGLRLRVALERDRRAHPGPAGQDRQTFRRHRAGDRARHWISAARRRRPAPAGTLMIRRSPLRLRLAAACTAMMALVLLAVAWVTLHQSREALDESTNAALSSWLERLLATGRSPSGPGPPVGAEGGLGETARP